MMKILKNQCKGLQLNSFKFLKMNSGTDFFESFFSENYKILRKTLKNNFFDSSNMLHEWDITQSIKENAQSKSQKCFQETFVTFKTFRLIESNIFYLLGKSVNI